MIDLALVKQHCRIEHDDEDALLQIYINAAVINCKHYLNREICADDEALKSASDGAIVINDAIRSAILITAGYLYEHREGTADSGNAGIPKSAQHLLNHYRRFAGL